MDENNLLNRLKDYTGDENLYDSVVDINVIYNVVMELSDNKAVGNDKLSAEHLKYSHQLWLRLYLNCLKYLLTVIMCQIALALELLYLYLRTIIAIILKR